MSNSNPRVAVVGKTRSILTWLDDTVAGFRELGCQVAPIAFQANSTAERLSQRAGHGKALHNPNIVARAAKELADFSPDLVVVLNKAGLPEAAADAWRQALRPKVPMVGWLCDCITGPPVGPLPVFDAIYYFDSFCLPSLEKYLEIHKRPAKLGYLPLAVNPARYPYAARQTAIPKLVFVGKCSRHRQQIFRELRAAGLPLELFGPGAGNRLRPWRNRRLSSAKITTLYREYLAVFNPPQPGNTEYGLNLRAFEIPAAGGVGFYPEVPDLTRCFVPDQEILAYRSTTELAEKFELLLRNPEYAEAVIAAGRQRVLAEHTFTHRARSILSDWFTDQAQRQAV